MTGHACPKSSQDPGCEDGVCEAPLDFDLDLDIDIDRYMDPSSERASEFRGGDAAERLPDIYQ